MAEYITTIGLEVHAQLLTASKMFCGCPSATAGAASIPPNSQVCPICLGMPGVLPVINQRAIELVLLTGLALNCEVALYSKFDRKNYPYPDLMKGYQISQYDLPLCRDGRLEIETPGGRKPVGIIRVHAEEDTARLLHVNDNGSSYTLIDVNRAGVPLMEIVGAPDIASPEEAEAYLTKLRQILVYIGASTGNMEEGSFRCDANVSVRRSGQQEFGTKVEIKNMNSFKAVRQALEYEVKRQVEFIESGGRVAQETRGWNDERRVTVGQRSKEFAHDYRYFPEPDLPALTFTAAGVEAIRSMLPELPDARRERFVAQYALAPGVAEEITRVRARADYYESVAAAAFASLPADGGERRAEKARDVANLLRAAVFPLMSAAANDAAPISPAALAELLTLVDEKVLVMSRARELVPELARTGEMPRRLVEERGLARIGDASELQAIVAQIIADNPKIVSDYLGGKAAALNGLIGPLMRATKGKADPNVAKQLLKSQLDALAAARSC